MSEVATTVAAPPHARRARDFVRGTWYIGRREIRLVWRTPAALLPGLFIPVFFFFVQAGSLTKVAQASGFVGNYKAFILPVSILFAVSNGGAGLNMVQDIESGYFDKLVLTPTNRLALLLGAMGADFARVLVQGLFTAFVAYLVGVHWATGAVGLIAMVALASLWGLAYSAMGFGIALKTGSAQATQSAFVLFFPFVFLTTSFAPKEALSGWLATAATYNPMTYLLSGMRGLGLEGWHLRPIVGALLAIGVVASITITAAMMALRGRVK